MGKKNKRNKRRQNLEPEWDSMTESSTSSSNTDTAGGNNNDDTPAVGQQASGRAKVAPVEQSSAGMTQAQEPIMSMMMQQVSFYRSCEATACSLFNCVTYRCSARLL